MTKRKLIQQIAAQRARVAILGAKHQMIRLDNGSKWSYDEWDNYRSVHYEYEVAKRDLWALTNRLVLRKL
jgi:hypothetical protein